MSKPTYKWYGNVIRAIGYYPNLLAEKKDKQGASITASYSGMPRSGQPSRTSENCAMRQLSPREEEELEAVRLAIEDIGRQRDGRDILRIVEMVDWARTHTLQGAADRLHISERTARALRSRFIYAVAKNMRYK
jgi:phage transcriptional activator, RinA family